MQLVPVENEEHNPADALRDGIQQRYRLANASRR